MLPASSKHEPDQQAGGEITLDRPFCFLDQQFADFAF
jgi:hypothetical protein